MIISLVAKHTGGSTIQLGTRASELVPVPWEAGLPPYGTTSAHSTRAFIKSQKNKNQPSQQNHCHHLFLHRMVLRLATDDSRTSARLSMKFGATLKSCRHLLETAKGMNIKVIGLR